MTSMQVAMPATRELMPMPMWVAMPAAWPMMQATEIAAAMTLAGKDKDKSKGKDLAFIDGAFVAIFAGGADETDRGIIA